VQKFVGRQVASSASTFVGRSSS